MSAIVDGPKKLAEAVRTRRTDLGLKQAELADRARLSLDRVQAVEGARHSAYRDSTLAKLDAALGWTPGSAGSVLTGGDATEAELAPEPPAVYRVTVVTSSHGAGLETFRLTRPTWTVSSSDTLQISAEDGPVASFAAGYWRSISREELDR